MGSRAVNNLLNLTVFLRVARLRSFSAAAREQGVATSVVTRRIDQLERALGTKLLMRSTRGLTLTAAAENLLPRFVRMTAEFDELFRGTAVEGECIEGHLRIKAPTTVTTEFLGALFTDFLQLHPGVTMDVSLVDHTVNPLEEGYDICLGAMPVSYPNVIDIPLCPYELVVCCAPSYLRGKNDEQRKRGPKQERASWPHARREVHEAAGAVLFAELMQFFMNSLCASPGAIF